MSRLKKSKQDQRKVRHARVRAKISGTSERPRLNVFRSLTSISLQLIDDATGKTLIGLSSKTQKTEGVDAGERKGKVAIAYVLGKIMAEKAKEQNISSIVFDRGGFAFNGRVKAVADGARDAGLQF
jgi:large subunit ribosomal protein L18